MRHLFFALALFTLLAGHAKGMRAVGSTTALLDVRELPRGSSEVSDVPLGLLLALQVEDLGIQGINDTHAVLQAWGRYQAGKNTLSDNEAELNLAYVEGRKGPLALRLGRQHAIDGSARMVTIDGIDARLQLPMGVAVSTYAGTLVLPERPLTIDLWTAGGRVQGRVANVGQVALNFRHEAGSWGLRHQDLSADGFYYRGPVRVFAAATMDVPNQNFAEGRVTADYRFCDCLTLSVDAERVRPTWLIPQTSIFSVFSTAAHDSLGAAATFRPGAYWEFSARGGAVLLKTQYSGYQFEGRAITYRDPSHRSLIGVELRRADDSTAGYWRGRVLSVVRLRDDLRLAGDLYTYYYDDPINSAQSGVLVQVSGVADVFSGGRLVASVAGGSTPQAERSIEGLLRFVYNFDSTFGGAL